ncbi:TrkH family potassium uptake protein [Anoxybacillus suryakundensis]|uniref:Trk-type K+ transport system, membrane component n=1 Tax=Anoxybacillus suryakundensis TaxID=1325335 RepID=A0A0K6GNE2_9BACL|nr:TrkH family potassium uptake protein [Anoxybacillus suryakundensis]CUA80210.1 Trk-type K+ transport system, membrane component [Anoxybacillus suryakundensis]
MKSQKLSRLSTVQLIVLFYFVAVCISTLLLWLPFFHQPGVKLSFVDALFTAVSAISVTGLTVVSTVDTFNTPGVFVLAFILQFGGIGIMALGTFIWLMFGKKIGFRERQLIMTDQNRSTFAGLVKLMKEILTLIIAIEMIGAIILGIYFLRYFPTWKEAFFQGFFASVSATTNAGFDITGQSLIPFANDYFVQTVHMILLVLGAIGFPVLIEVKEFLFHRQKRQYRFSLFTKLTTVTFFLLVLFGTWAILLIEWNRFFSNKTWHESLFYALFQSISSRNGGLATMDVADFSEPTLLVLSALMFIGASPSSVGGGIRTTTFAIMMLSIFFYAKGKNSIKVFQREIHHEDILKSFIVFGTAFILCFLAIVLLSFSESFTMIEIVFEVCSAFGTTGLSMGITSQLSTFGKLVITVLMFIGRIGILSFLFLIRGNNQKESYHYPKERIIIG